MLLLEDLRRTAGLLEDPRAPLQKALQECRRELLRTRRLLDTATRIAVKYDDKVNVNKKKYSLLDRKLAMVDGRYKVYNITEVEMEREKERKKNAKPKAKAPEPTPQELVSALTLEQRAMLLKALKGEL